MDDTRPVEYTIQTDASGATVYSASVVLPGTGSLVEVVADGDTPQSMLKAKYAMANRILGDIPKVTPSSKVVGDLADRKSVV